jgi:streptogramin lyase
MPCRVLLGLCLLASRPSFAGALLYETNEIGNTVGKYSTEGVLVGALNPSSPFRTPYVSAVGPSHDVYVSDYSNGRVIEFSPAGVEINSFSSGLGNPGGIAFDAASNLFVVDRSNGNILEYSDGTESIVTNVSGARGLAYFGGLLYAASSSTGSVVSVDPSSHNQSVFATSIGGGDLRGIAFDTGGDLFVTDVASGDIFRFAAGTNSPTTFATGLAAPEYLAVGADGSLYVPEFSAGDVRVIGADGVDRGVLISGLDAPSSVAVAETPEPSYVWCTGLVISQLWRKKMLHGGFRGSSKTRSRLTQLNFAAAPPTAAVALDKPVPAS